MASSNEWAAAMCPLTRSLLAVAELRAELSSRSGLRPSSNRDSRDCGTVTGHSRPVESSEDSAERKEDREEDREGAVEEEELPALGPQSACRHTCHALSRQSSSARSTEAREDEGEDGVAAATAAPPLLRGGGCPYNRARTASSSRGRKASMEGAVRRDWGEGVEDADVSDMTAVGWLPSIPR
jgi:hypothetical protein